MRVHDSQANRKMDVTWERISRILELTEILLSIQTGFSLVYTELRNKGRQHHKTKKTKTSKNGTRLTKDTITKIGKHTAEPNYLFKMGYSPLITEEWRSVQTHISLSVSNDCITPTVAIWGY